MYKIKQLPEDFIVKEITSTKPKDKGRFSYFLLKKKNYTTVKAVETIAEKLKIPSKKISFAGTKDKNAITEQLISILGKEKEIKLKDIQTKFLGKGDEPVSLGDLKGNYFEIVIRNLEKIPKLKNKKSFINYFGEQRFSKNNKAVGKSILKKDFEKTVKLILTNKGAYEAKVKEYLEKNKQDYIGALRKIPKKILKFYVHAYQSWLWNNAVKEFVKNKEIKNQKIPIIGFATEIKNNEIGKIIKNILKKEEIELRDFIIRQIPELSSEGDKRNLLIEVKDLKILEQGKDELNNKRFKVRLSFTLPKAAYATTFIKSIF